ncbi:MAG: HAD hydrolase-like protein [Patescibacteria group bacterium]
MAYPIIFFDLDGTLIDPKIGITKAAQHALKRMGIEEDTENLLKFIGPPLHKSFQEYYGFSEEKAMEGVLHYREYFHPTGMYESTVYPDIIAVLTNLQQSGNRLLVVTSKPTWIAEKIVQHHGLDTFFEKVVGSQPDLSNADKTDLVAEALALFPDQPKYSFVMIGDRKHDIFGAQANAIDSVGVYYGYGAEDEISKAKPTHIVKNVKDLLQYL